MGQRRAAALAKNLFEFVIFGVFEHVGTVVSRKSVIERQKNSLAQ